MSEWKPIETAPKDGTRVLVFRPIAEPTPYMQNIGTDRFLNGVWYFSNKISQPTHWMLLPKKPESKNE